MAVFRDEPETFGRLDYSLLQSGPIHLYWNKVVLDEDVACLADDGYRIEVLDAARWTSEIQMHDEFMSRLHFPDYYGRNLNALKDCLCDVEVGENDGLILVFHSYDQLVRHSSSLAWDVLDIISLNAWEHLLYGRRLLALVQSANPRLSFKPVGGKEPKWNPREWMNHQRGL